MRRVNRLAPDEAQDVLRLLAAAADHDGVPPVSEHVTIHLRSAPDADAVDFLAYDGGAIAGYAHLDLLRPGASAELGVHPDHRRRGVAGALLAELLAQPERPLDLWAHGRAQATAAERLATARGFVPHRVLRQMRRPLDEPLPERPLPEGVRVRTFRVGEDEQAWLAVNARAFASHPEQGRWTIADLRAREGEAWFEPAGFFLAERAARLVGFHWTKVHRGSADAADIGEVYVLGVDPSEQGRGLGPALTVVGLAHLRAQGLPQVMLYVDEGNRAAVRLYESLGFTLWDSDVSFRHD